MLIILGVLLLLDNLGAFIGLHVSVWSLFWPLFLVALGLWVLWGAMGRRGYVQTERAEVPLAAVPVRRASIETEQAAVPQEAGVARARIRVRHGAGRLQIGAGAAPGNLADGSFVGGLDCQRQQVGDTVELDMRPRFRDWTGPWGLHNSLDWDLRLTGNVPMTLELEMGASESHLDLADLRVTDLSVKTGASSTHLMLPAHAGETRVRVESGAAAVNVVVPTGVAARIRSGGALSNTRVDELRFPRQGDVYQSVNYDTAPNKVDVVIQAAVGSVDIR